MKFDLNVSMKVRFIANDQGIRLKNHGKYSVLLKVLLCIL